MGEVQKGLDQVSDVVKKVPGVNAVLDLGNAGYQMIKGIGGGLGPKSADLSGLNAMQGTALAREGEQYEDLNAIRGQKNAFAQQLAQQAMGQGPSLAQAQLQAAQDKTLAQQLAAARSSRGVNPALLARSLAQSQGQQGAQLGQAAAQARLQEQMQNQNAFQNYLANQQSHQAALLGQGTNAASAAAAANAANANQQNQFTGNLMGLGSAAMMAFSDKNLKKNVKPVDAKPALKQKYEKQKPKQLPGYADGGFVMPEQQLQQYRGQVPQAESFESLLKRMTFDNTSKDGFKAMGTQLGGMLKPGETAPQDLAQSPMMDFAPGPGQMMAAQGGKVPGTPVVKGDSPKNDIVHAKLSPGEVVLPRTVVAKGPEAAARFVDAILKQPKNTNALESAKASNPKMGINIDQPDNSDQRPSKGMSNGGKVEKTQGPREFLDALKAYTYEYKNPAHGKGQQLSVMAQDLEKAGPVGQAMVENTPEGKVVNYGKGFGTILAAQVELNKRLADIERKYGKKES